MERFAEGTIPEVIVRAVGSQDINWLISREEESAKYPWSIKQLAESSEAGYYCGIVSSQNQDVGYFVLLHATGVSEILNLVVFKVAQNQGYGTKMIELILCESKKNSSDVLWLEVRKSNEIAQKLYIGAGFKVSGIRKNYYTAELGGREDALLMTLAL